MIIVKMLPLYTIVSTILLVDSNNHVIHWISPSIKLIEFNYLNLSHFSLIRKSISSMIFNS